MEDSSKKLARELTSQYVVVDVNVNGFDNITFVGKPFLSRKSALQYLSFIAEQYCIERDGEKNFVRGQLDQTCETLSIKKGYVLSRPPNRDDTINIYYKVPGTLYGHYRTLERKFYVAQLPLPTSQAVEDIIRAQIESSKLCPPASTAIPAVAQEERPVSSAKQEAYAQVIVEFKTALARALTDIGNAEVTRIDPTGIDVTANLVPRTFLSNQDPASEK